MKPNARNKKIPFFEIEIKKASGKLTQDYVIISLFKTISSSRA
jgi:hypothetical protein